MKGPAEACPVPFDEYLTDDIKQSPSHRPTKSLAKAQLLDLTAINSQGKDPEEQEFDALAELS